MLLSFNIDRGDKMKKNIKELLPYVIIIGVVIFVSVKNPNINVLGTILGLVSTQIVIFVKKLIITKITRKGV